MLFLRDGVTLELRALNAEVFDLKLIFLYGNSLLQMKLEFYGFSSTLIDLFNAESCELMSGL